MPHFDKETISNKSVVRLKLNMYHLRTQTYQLDSMLLFHVNITLTLSNHDLGLEEKKCRLNQFEEDSFFFDVTG